MIPFSKPPTIKNQQKYIKKALADGKLCGGNYFTKKCESFFEKQTGAKKVFLTPSCTAALEMCALLLDIKKDDEVIMPSFTFVSTANAFVLRGAKIVFVDIRPDTMNIDENLIQKAISKKTKAIVVVHYAGVGCEMDTICKISKKYNIPLIEDAAQGVNAYYKNKALGTFGTFGTFSFHETKNYVSGEGGALLINEKRYIKKAEILREKGTNRSEFFRGEVDKYSWISVGSSFLPSELQAALLMSQLDIFDNINKDRLKSWQRYYKKLLPLKRKGFIGLPKPPLTCKHNAHIFYIKTKNINERTALMKFLKKHGIYATFHYVPLHTSAGGKKFGKFFKKDKFTTSHSDKLLRLPLFYGLTYRQIDFISDSVKLFFSRT